MKKYSLIVLILFCSLIILSGCGPKFFKHEWIKLKIVIDSEPTEAKVFNTKGERLGYTPYVFERKFAKQYWDDGDIAFFENEEPYEPGTREKFTAVVLKEGYRKQLVEMNYTFDGKKSTTHRKMVFLNK